jgi:hypothetical protein
MAMNCNAITLFLASTLIGTTVANPADAVQITVKVVSAADNSVGIESTILQRQNGEVKEFITDETGSHTFDLAACDAQVAFRAKPGTWLYTEVESWTQCSQDPTLLPLPKVEFADVLEPAFKFEFTFASAPPELISSRAKFLAFVQDGDDAAAAATANDIAAMLRELGVTDVAKAYSAAAIYGGWRAIGVEPIVEGNVALLSVDPNQGLLVMTPAGQDVLQAYQARAGIPETGVWDWRTYNELVTSPRT